MALGDGELDGGDLLFGLVGLLLLADARQARQVRAAEDQALRDAAAAEKWAATHRVTFEVHQVIQRGREIREQRAWAEATRRLTSYPQRVMRSVGWAVLLLIPAFMLLEAVLPGKGLPDQLTLIVLVGIFLLSLRRYAASHEAALQRMDEPTRRRLHHHGGSWWHAHSWTPGERHRH